MPISESPISSPDTPNRNTRVPVSVVVHTWNEEHNIEDCLQSVKGWADEILVMDMESTDRTVELASKYADKVISHPNLRLADPARNTAIAQCRNEWVFCLDADERATPELQARVDEVLAAHGDEISAVQLPYKNVVFGRWIEHMGSWWPGFKAPMLVKKSKVRFRPEVHSLPDVDGPTVAAHPRTEHEAVVHYNYKTVNEWITKANRYTDLEVDVHKQRNTPVSWQLAAQTFGNVLGNHYDATNGKLDGVEGWLLTLCCAMYELYGHMKYWEALKGQQGFDPRQCMPPSAADFLAMAFQAAGGSLQAPAPSEPQWIVPLIQMLRPGSRSGSFFACPAAEEAARQAGWKVKQDAKHADAEVLWKCEEARPDQLTRLAMEARAGTLIMLGFPQTDQPNELRDKLETLFDATVHLLDPEQSCDRLVAFLWNRERTPIERRVLISLNSNALQMMGGGEMTVFTTHVRAAREHGVRSDVSTSLRLGPEGYDLVHLLSLYQAEHVETVKSWKLPTVVTPTWWDGPRVQWATSVLPVVLAPERPEEERQTLVSLYTRRELGANGETIEQAKFAPDVTRALATVRDCATKVIATGPQEVKEMNRALGDSDLPSGAIHVGVEADIFDKATPDLFVEKFGLRDFVLCVGRVEPMKNQLMLAYALRGTGRKLVLMGPAPNQAYLELCKHWGGDDLAYVLPQPPEMVASALKAAACHALPSWWEVPGLVSLEAAVAGCPAVVTDCGTIRHYLGDSAHYCDPADPRSIREAVEAACAEQGTQALRDLRERCLKMFTVRRCAAAFRSAYDSLLEGGTVKLLVVPDWRRPSTWQPVLGAFLTQYGPSDNVCLSMLVDTPTDANSWAAQNLLMGYCEENRIDLDRSADIELADLASVGEVAGVLQTGSLAERQLCQELGISPVDWQDAWAQPQAA